MGRLLLEELPPLYRGRSGVEEKIARVCVLEVYLFPFRVGGAKKRRAPEGALLLDDRASLRLQHQNRYSALSETMSVLRSTRFLPVKLYRSTPRLLPV